MVLSNLGTDPLRASSVWRGLRKELPPPSVTGDRRADERRRAAASGSLTDLLRPTKSRSSPRRRSGRRPSEGYPGPPPGPPAQRLSLHPAPPRRELSGTWAP